MYSKNMKWVTVKDEPPIYLYREVTNFYFETFFVSDKDVTGIFNPLPSD